MSILRKKRDRSVNSRGRQRLKKVAMPKLQRLREELCTVEELQVTLVKLIDLHNVLVGEIAQMLERGQIHSAYDLASKQRLKL